MKLSSSTSLAAAAAELDLPRFAFLYAHQSWQKACKKRTASMYYLLATPMKELINIKMTFCLEMLKPKTVSRIVPK